MDKRTAHGEDTYQLPPRGGKVSPRFMMGPTWRCSCAQAHVWRVHSTVSHKNIQDVSSITRVSHEILGPLIQSQTQTLMYARLVIDQVT